MKTKILALIIVAIVAIVAAISLTNFQPGHPDFQIISPKDGEVVGGDVQVTLNVKNFKIVSPPENQVLENVYNEGHFHVYIDGSEATYDQVASENFVLRNFTSGPHKIRVSMRNNDHYPYGIDKNVSFTVQ